MLWYIRLHGKFRNATCIKFQEDTIAVPNIIFSALSLGFISGPKSKTKVRNLKNQNKHHVKKGTYCLTSRYHKKSVRALLPVL